MYVILDSLLAEFVSSPSPFPEYRCVAPNSSPSRFESTGSRYNPCLLALLTLDTPLDLRRVISCHISYERTCTCVTCDLWPIKLRVNMSVDLHCLCMF